MFWFYYLLAGVLFWVLKTALGVALLSKARAQGQLVAIPETSPGWHLVSIAVWPIEALALLWRLAALGSRLLSAWLTTRRLRQASN